jgi:hypothetical protein
MNRLDELEASMHMANKAIKEYEGMEREMTDEEIRYESEVGQYFDKKTHRMEYTKGEWKVKNIPSHGLEIFAEVNIGNDENGGVLQPIYNVDIKPYVRIGDDGKAYVIIAYESWRQFPSVNFQKMQKANAQLIAAAPELYGALKAAKARLEEYHDITEGFRLERQMQKALAKAEGK